MKKIKSGEVKLEEAKKPCRMCLNQILMKYQKEDINQKSSKVHWKILSTPFSNLFSATTCRMQTRPYLMKSISDERK